VPAAGNERTFAIRAGVRGEGRERHLSRRRDDGLEIARAGELALGLGEAIGRYDLAAAVRDLTPMRDDLLRGVSPALVH